MCSSPLCLRFHRRCWRQRGECQGQIHTCPMRVHVPLNLWVVTLAKPGSEWRQHPTRGWWHLCLRGTNCHVEPGDVGKRLPDIHAPFDAGGHCGGQLLLEEPTADISVYGSASVGKKNNPRLPRSKEIAETTSSLLPRAPLVLEGAASCSAWKSAFCFPDQTYFIASLNPVAFMPGMLQVSSLLSSPVGYIYGA